MFKLKNLFQKIFGKKVRVEEEEIDHTVYLTEIPGLVTYRGTHILTSPKKYALRKGVA